MIKRVNKLEEVGEIIGEGKPVEILYDLGKEGGRTELLVTYVDGGSRVSDRITSSPLIKLCENKGGISMDITDSNQNADGYSYTGLRPQGVVFRQPENPPYELGDLAIDIGEGRQLAIAPYYRMESDN